MGLDDPCKRLVQPPKSLDHGLKAGALGEKLGCSKTVDPASLTEVRR